MVSGDRHPTSDDRRPMSDDRRSMSDDRCPMSDDRRPMSGDRRPMSGDGCPMSDDRRPRLRFETNSRHSSLYCLYPPNHPCDQVDTPNLGGDPEICQDTWHITVLQ